MANNKVNYGLKNVHYSKITYGTDGKVIYAVPKRIPGAVSLSLDVAGEQSVFYADDIAYFTTNSNQGYEGTLEIADIPQEFATEILGETLDADTKVLIENVNGKPSEFALMFEFDGDVKATRHVFYRCSANRPSISGSTKEESVEVATRELTFTAMAREVDGTVKTKTTIETPAHIYDAWYKKVFDGVKNSIQRNEPEYSKATGDLELPIQSVEADIDVIGVTVDGVVIEKGENTWTYADKKLVIKNAYLDGLENRAKENPYKIIIQTNKGNDILVKMSVVD